MAKRASNQTTSITTELIVEKSEFTQILNDRIALGEEIYNRTIQTKEDFEKMKSDFSSWADYNIEYLKQSFNNPNNEYKKTYENAGFSFLGTIRRGGSNDNPVQEKKSIISAHITNLKNLVTKTPLLKSSIIKSLTPSHSIHNRSGTMNEVFIVHGHHESAKQKTARFIEKLGFKPIILHEQASSGKTIIEKIEEYSNVGFGIVVYTPCDVGSKQSDSTKLKPRARQNVVFEHGYLIGKIGRSNVCALVKGDIETPNDISGVVYVNMDDDDAWHLKMAKELRNSGYEVDMNKVI